MFRFHSATATTRLLTRKNSLVNAAEDGSVTTGYTDYFPADGMQTTETIHCVGAAGIQKCKEAFLVNGRELVVSLNDFRYYELDYQ